MSCHFRCAEVSFFEDLRAPRRCDHFPWNSFCQMFNMSRQRAQLRCLVAAQSPLVDTHGDGVQQREATHVFFMKDAASVGIFLSGCSLRVLGTILFQSMPQ